MAHAKNPGATSSPRNISTYFGSKLVFIALVPMPINNKGSEARIGLCIDNTAKKSLKQYFTNLLKNKTLQNIKITQLIAGTIPLGALKKTTTSNVLLVGDAAAQVKPTSGGGIYPGLVCAKHCSSISVDALENNDFSNQYRVIGALIPFQIPLNLPQITDNTIDTPSQPNHNVPVDVARGATLVINEIRRYESRIFLRLTLDNVKCEKGIDRGQMYFILLDESGAEATIKHFSPLMGEAMGMNLFTFGGVVAEGETVEGWLEFDIKDLGNDFTLYFWDYNRVMEKMGRMYLGSLQGYPPPEGWLDE